MGAVVDTLILGHEELNILTIEYTRCILRNLTNTAQAFQHYRIIIENENEEDYYDFLVQNKIAMSSHKFYSRVKSDKIFASKMDLRMRMLEVASD